LERRTGQGFWFALQFLTRLPTPRLHATTAAQLGSALPYFPVVGLLLGGVLVALDAALRPLLAPSVVDALLVASLVVLSGALHLDGLVDTTDALCTTATPAARLALMHDSRAHDAGTLAACFLLLIKFTALQVLPAEARVPALLAAPLLGRWANVAAYWGYPYARRTPGASLALKQHATTRCMVGRGRDRPRAGAAGARAAPRPHGRRLRRDYRDHRDAWAGAGAPGVGRLCVRPASWWRCSS
jgi:adenosylcobinamide-GDP ribazoletransferase